MQLLLRVSSVDRMRTSMQYAV